MSDIKEKAWGMLEMGKYFEMFKGFEEVMKYTPEQCFSAAWDNTMKDVDEEEFSKYLDMMDKYRDSVVELFLQCTEFASEAKDEFKTEEEVTVIQ